MDPLSMFFNVSKNVLKIYSPVFLVIFSLYKQALALDDGGLYKERLEVSLRRLELRAQLYKQPDRAEDIAAMIIEQVVTCTLIKTERRVFLKKFLDLFE